jgi:hypothetical protein
VVLGGVGWCWLCREVSRTQRRFWSLIGSWRPLGRTIRSKPIGDQLLAAWPTFSALVGEHGVDGEFAFWAVELKMVSDAVECSRPVGPGSLSRQMLDELVLEINE